MAAESSILDRLTKVEGTSAESLASSLGQIIRGGELAGGATIPSERKLSSRLRLPRNAVRIALRQLEAEGLIDGQQGRLRRVCGTTKDSSFMRHTIVVLGLQTLPNHRVREEQGWNTYAQITASARLQKCGYHYLTLNPETIQASQVDRLCAEPPAGLLLPRFIHAEKGRHVLDRMCAIGVPTAIYGDAGTEMVPQCDWVYHDHAAGAEALTRWLIQRGCRQILPFWRFPAKQAWVRQREAGYQRAMREAGLSPLTPLCTPDLRLSDDKEPFDDMVRLQMGFLHGALSGANSVDALMCANDLHAVEAAEAVRRLGRTPGRDVLITGYDNTWQRDGRNPDRLDPPAATIDKNNACIGELLADLILKRIANELPPAPQQCAVEFTLVSPGCD